MTMWDYMIKIKPYLPEPSGQPYYLFANTTNCPLMKRWVFLGNIKVYDAQKSVLRR